jgi:hypothetical protein
MFESHVAEAVFDGLVAEQKVPVHREELLDRANGVVKSGGRVLSIRTESGKTFVGKVFIDATYEGDLMASSGVSYTVGRESNSVYHETLNGDRAGAGGTFMKRISAYKVPGDPSSGVLPFISTEPPGKRGEGDRRVQAYCYRMCLTKRAANRVPFPKPEGYSAANYELLLRLLRTGDIHICSLDSLPNEKTASNNLGPFSSDFIGMSDDYPEGSYERRREIVKAHQDYQKGLYYFMVHDPRVPARARELLAPYGLAADEFKDNGNWPYQLYVRGARRMISTYVMTEHNLRGQTHVVDSIGLASCGADSHECHRYITADGDVQNEGGMGLQLAHRYGISYAAIVPKKAQCINLLVPVCVSSSLVGYASLRMEAVYMFMGQAAGAAAAHAVEEGVAVQDVDYPRLRERLLADGQRL